MAQCMSWEASVLTDFWGYYDCALQECEDNYDYDEWEEIDDED